MLIVPHAARPGRLLVAFAAVLAAVATALLLSSPALASNCGNRSTTKAFARFGDTNQYFLIPGGSFESGLTGWSLTNAGLASGNESYFLNSTTDHSSLRIGQSAVSPSFCIAKNEPLVRFAAKSVTNPGSNGNYSQLNVTAVVRNSAGSVKSFFLGALPAPTNSNWFVTPMLQWGSPLDDWLFANGTATIQFQFNVQGQGGTWYIDDVYVDPFMGT
jgi:hypothetical protein